MIRHRPVGFIEPKAEAFAVNTYKHMRSRFSWFAAALALGEMPNETQYKREIVNLAAHEYVDRGDPEQDTVNALLKVVKWHTMGLRANLNGMLTTSKTVHWPTATGEEQHWRLALQATDFDTVPYFKQPMTAETGYAGVEAWDELSRTLAPALARMSPQQREAFLLWVDAGAEPGAYEVVGRQMGVSRQRIGQLLAVAKDIAGKEYVKSGIKGTP